MKKQNYSAPKLEQVKMETEMPVMAGSAPSKSNLSAMTVGGTGIW